MLLCYSMDRTSSLTVAKDMHCLETELVSVFFQLADGNMAASVLFMCINMWQYLNEILFPKTKYLVQVPWLALFWAKSVLRENINHKITEWHGLKGTSKII